MPEFLRESIAGTSFSMIRESLIANKEESESHANPSLNTIDEDSLSNENSAEVPSMCDVILKQAVCMKKEDRDSLIKFLSKIDHNE